MCAGGIANPALVRRHEAVPAPLRCQGPLALQLPLLVPPVVANGCMHLPRFESGQLDAPTRPRLEQLDTSLNDVAPSLRATPRLFRPRAKALLQRTVTPRWRRRLRFLWRYMDPAAKPWSRRRRRLAHSSLAQEVV